MVAPSVRGSLIALASDVGCCYPVQVLVDRVVEEDVYFFLNVK